MTATAEILSKTSFRVLQTNDGRTLVENPQRLTVAGTEPSTMLVVTDAGISVQERTDAMPTSTSAIVSSKEIMGVIGFLDLPYGKYLVAVATRMLVATIKSHKIWRIKSGIILAVGSTVYPASIEDMDDSVLAKYAADTKLCAHIHDILDSGNLYYSTTYDLTHSLQHNHLSKSGRSTTTRTIIDDRYFFNQYMQEALMHAAKPQHDTSPWLCKVIAGFAGSIDIDYVPAPTVTPGLSLTTLMTEKPTSYTVTLVSRLNCRRLGTRYACRGLDDHGNVANNVEMEQILFNHDYMRNRLIFFEQDLSYRPRLLLSEIDKDSSWVPVKKHYEDLKCQYVSENLSYGHDDHGTVVCVNLLDDTGFEKPLTDNYESTVKRFKDPKLLYESFPVGKWCKKLNYDNMDILLDRVRLRLVNNGCFVAEGDVPGIESCSTLHDVKLQTGVARVSCLDSLDRTNLTCSIFARHMVAHQVQQISLGPHGPRPPLPLTGVSPLEVRDSAAHVRASLSTGIPLLTHLWADSGDAISLLYAGTRALKADVTRTGKRQVFKGSLDDGMNSLTRYYLNNFTDGRKQDAYDIWSGKASMADIHALVANQGVKQAHRLRRPLISKNKGLGRILPQSVVDAIEPLLFEIDDFFRRSAGKAHAEGGRHVDALGTPHSVVGLMVSLVKMYSPSQISSLFDFAVAGWMFVYLFVLVKLFRIKGEHVVNKPRLFEN
ncbi:hypothetical protein BASA83_008497 [Batrachochytrium salamandrivorans]|nr:hypothetical protein BASA83_008497 [Batrachochytrium salamandrivorans]